MKKITDILAGFLTAALVLTVVMPATTALAAANVTDGGYGVLEVMNYTQYPNSNANWVPSLTANPGDTVSFGIYYQNEGPDTAQNVRVFLTQPGANALTSHTLQARVTGDNMGQITGSATVNVATAQTLQFNGTVNWDRNTNGTGSALANGTAIFNSTGVPLGNIAPGEYGTVVVRFTVGNSGGTVNPPAAQNPVVTTGVAQVFGQNSATLNGSIDFRGTFANANCYFEYGTSNALGTITNGNGVASSAVQNFASTVNGLNSNTTYSYRAVCQSNGQTFQGSILTFTTQSAPNPVVNDPIVTTGGATVFNQNSAQVNGSVDFRGTFQSGSCYFEYGQNGFLGNTSGSQSASGSNSQSFNTTLNGLTSNTVYSYRAVCQMNGRTFQGTILTFVTGGANNNTVDPIVTTGSVTNINSNTVSVNGSIDFRGSFQTGVCFFEYGQNGFLGNISSTQNVSNSNFQNFSATLSNLNQGITYYYRANCQVNGRNFTGSTLTFNTQNQIVNPNFLSVTTNPATEVFAQSGRVNGSVVTGGQLQTVTGWFEYGRTTGLGSQTAVGNLGSLTSATFTNVLLNLTPGTTYYFRAVAQNQFGQIARGNILSFTTPFAVVQPPVYVPPAPVAPVYVAPLASPIVISYGLDNVHPLPGDVVLYRIGWLNQGPNRLTNGILRVTLPAGLTYLDSTSGIARDGQTLIYPVGNINVGGSGAITFRALIDRSVPIGIDLPMSIRMDFYTPATGKNGDVTITGYTHVAPDNTTVFINQQQPSPVTVVTIATTTPIVVPAVVENQAFLGGVFGGSFFPQTAAGWLLLLILAVLIVALIRRALVAPRV